MKIAFLFCLRRTGFKIDEATGIARPFRVLLVLFGGGHTEAP